MLDLKWVDVSLTIKIALNVLISHFRTAITNKQEYIHVKSPGDEKINFQNRYQNLTERCNLIVPASICRPFHKGFSLRGRAHRYLNTQSKWPTLG